MRCVVLLILLCANAAFGQAYYHITSVTSEQLANAVRVTIEADGAISANPWKWLDEGYYIDFEELNRHGYPYPPECFPKVSKVYVHLDNAIPRVGAVAHVGKYPVSHVELVMTPEEAGRFGVDMAVVLHKPVRFRNLKFAGWDVGDAYAFHQDPEWFEVVQSDDQRSLIVTVTSDRLPQTQDHLRLADVPEEQRELTVSCENGFLDVRARNAALVDLVDAVSRASGRQMVVDSGVERVVTAELAGVTPDELSARLAECYGLVLTGNGERLVFSETLAQSASAYTAGAIDRLPVSSIRAREARNLLPNFLLDYVRVDEETNALVVSGSRALADKIRTDLAKIDRPASVVQLEAVVMESSSTRDLAYQLELGWSNDGFEVTSDPSEGEIVFRKLGVLGPEFRARLDALAASQKVKVLARTSVAVESGENAELFAGVDKYIQFRRQLYDRAEILEPVGAGVRLNITPWAGERHIGMDVGAEVKDVGELDPLTRLPVINARSAEGTYRLASGETVLIGGLTQTQSEIAVRKVPILGDIPLIGKLFRKKVRRQSRTELAVLITPSIMESSIGPVGRTERGQGPMLQSDIRGSEKRNDTPHEVPVPSEVGERPGVPARSGPGFEHDMGIDLRYH